MEAKKRAHLIVSGRVQGVFFREETRKAATRLGVAGWVRNKSDGTVEAVIEGPENDVSALIDWCHKGPTLSRVARVAVRWEDYRDAFDRFEVRF